MAGSVDFVLDGGVAETSRSRVLTSGPQAIWDVLADFGSLSSWADGIEHSCLLNSGPDGAGPGTTRRVQVRGNALVERITEFDPPVSLSYAIEGLPRRLGRLANRWTLRPVGTGTEVTLTSTVEIGTGRLAGLAERTIGRVMAKQSASMLAGLSRRLESRND